MNLHYGTKQVLHRIRVKLYPNYLLKGDAFLAKTDSEASIGIEEVCASLKNRGGFTGNLHDLVEHVKQYYEEVAYQLCDGYTVNNGYYSVYPNLGGTFKSARDTPNPDEHPLDFRFRPLKKLRDLAEHIAIVIDGEADAPAYIDTFTDTDIQAENEAFTPGNGFVIKGSKIKIAGPDTGNGLFMVTDDGSKEIQITRIQKNSKNEIVGILPYPCNEHQRNYIEIRTQFTGSSKVYLKKPRYIRSKFVLEEV